MYKHAMFQPSESSADSDEEAAPWEEEEVEAHVAWLNQQLHSEKSRWAAVF